MSSCTCSVSDAPQGLFSLLIITNKMVATLQTLVSILDKQETRLSKSCIVPVYELEHECPSFLTVR